MPRLADLLEYLAQPGLEEIWVLLDIKVDLHHDTVCALVCADVGIAGQQST